MARNPKQAQSETETENQAAGSNGATDKVTKKKVSRRFYVGPDGNEVDRIEEATGAGYEILGVANGDGVFRAQLGKAGAFETMCAIFGFHTKVGNVVNTRLNDKENPGSPVEAASDVVDFLDSARGGHWTTPGATREPKYDPAVVAACFIEVGGERGAKYAADPSPLVEKLTDDKALVRKLMQAKEMQAAYARRKPVQEKTLADIDVDL